MSINLLYIIQNDEFGGGERGFSQLIAGLDSRMFKIFVATTTRGRFYREIRETDATAFNIPFSRCKIPFAIKILKQIIMRENIDIIHSQGARADFIARFAVRRAKSTAMVSTVQMPVEGFDVPLTVKLIYIILDRISEKFVDTFIVVSQALRDHMIRKHGIAEERISLIYNGVELDKYTSTGQDAKKIRREFNVPQDFPLIGGIGRMVWQKGFEYLIESAIEIIKTFPNAKILIVGDGPLRERLKALGERLKVKENLIFTGFRGDVGEILSAIDILVVPSLLEGFPMITLEAMAMAKPIVATNIDGITEQIQDGVSGILVSPRNPELMAREIVRLLKDSTLAEKLGKLARQRVIEQFSVGRMVQETQKLYESLLKRRRHLYLS